MQHYSVVFNTTAGSRRSMRINNPNVDLPLEDIKDAVGEMIANDIFNPERGSLESLNRMELATIQRKTIL